MRSRTIREGSVGLLILLGLAVFVGLVCGYGSQFNPRQPYLQVHRELPNVAGMKQGATVRYRGVAVGKIRKFKPRLMASMPQLKLLPLTC
jgi:phospholipid/cholesterol/gamma-HCH transport system substrate-binding protein